MAINKIVEGGMLRLRSNVLAEEPIIMETIKQENTSPRGQLPPAESKIGVHKNTKMYIIDSKALCTMPRNKMVLSAKIARTPSKKVRPRPN